MGTLTDDSLSMEVEYAAPVQSSPDPVDYIVRPVFLKTEFLLQYYKCGICHDILLKPKQTACGQRVCERCIEDKLGNRGAINPCPLKHTDDDDSDYEDLPCQRNGLRREHISPDPAARNFLLRQYVFCNNKKYGCGETMPWKKLREHLRSCIYHPVKCPSHDCKELLAKHDIESHLENCGFVKVQCQYCLKIVKRCELEQHYDECPEYKSECPTCKETFQNRRQLFLHQQVNGPCAMSSTCSICDEQFDSVEGLRNHLQDPNNELLHFQAIAMRTVELKALQSTEASKIKDDMDKESREKLVHVVRTAAELAILVKKLKNQVDMSVVHADALENAIKEINKNTQLLSSLKMKVESMERLFRTAGLEDTDAFQQMRNEVRLLLEKSKEYEKRIKNLELATYDGVLIWRIYDYKKRKQDAVRGRQTSIFSPPFYSSRTGYKMCCRVYLNGDGVGRNQYLSVFFVVMKGDYDDLLEWPFRQRVTMSILSPGLPNATHTETFLPDSRSTSFQKPRNEMNIASGCPQFLLHSEVESSRYLLNDCIYIRIQVEPGGDKI